MLLIPKIRLATQVVVGLVVKNCITLVTLLGRLNCFRGTNPRTLLAPGRLLATLAVTKLGVIVPMATFWSVTLPVTAPAKLTILVPVVSQPVRLGPFTRLVIEVTPTTWFDCRPSTFPVMVWA